MNIYMAVTADAYELPIAIADTAVELAALLRTTPGCIYSYISREKNGVSNRGKRSGYVVKKILI